MPAAAVLLEVVTTAAVCLASFSILSKPRTVFRVALSTLEVLAMISKTMEPIFVTYLFPLRNAFIAASSTSPAVLVLSSSRSKYSLICSYTFAGVIDFLPSRLTISEHRNAKRQSVR